MLTLAEKFYIEGHPNSEPEQLAKELNLSPKEIVSYREFTEGFKKLEQERAPLPAKTEKPESLEEATGEVKSDEYVEPEKNVFLSSLGTRKEGGVCVMTATASEQADELAKINSAKKKNKNRYSCLRPARLPKRK